MGTLTDLAHARIIHSHGAAARSRVLIHRAALQWGVARAIDYAGVALEVRFLQEDVRRATRAAAQLEREQLRLGLRLLELGNDRW